MDWDKLRVFHAVAEAGSFTHAGESLNLSQSAVSRQISALEESLSVPLFHRHARGLILTEQGELLFRTAREVFAKLAMTEATDLGIEGPAEGAAEDHHHRRVRLDLADAADPRVPRPLSRDPGQPGGRRFRARPVDARGRRRDPHVAAAPARPDPASPGQRPGAHLRLARLPQEARHAAAAGGSRRASPDRLRRGCAAAGAAASTGCSKPAPSRAATAGRSSRSTTPTACCARSERARPRRAARFRRARARPSSVRVLPELTGPPNRGLFRLSRGAAHLEADQRVPRFPAAQGRRTQRRRGIASDGAGSRNRRRLALELHQPKPQQSGGRTACRSRALNPSFTASRMSPPQRIISRSGASPPATKARAAPSSLCPRDKASNSRRRRRRSAVRDRRRLDRARDDLGCR